MSRHFFGLTPADFAMQKDGDALLLRPGAVGTVYLPDGVTVQIDLMDRDHSTLITTVTADDDGMVGFYGPDGTPFGPKLLLIDFGFGQKFYLLAVTIGDELATKATDVAVVHVTGTETVGGDKTLTGATTHSGTVANTNTHAWTLPTIATHASQLGAVTIRNDNTVDATDSPDQFVIWYKGNDDAHRAGWFNEWGGIRVRVPSLTALGYADVACKLFEPTSGGEDGLQIYGPGGTKKFYVRDGVISGDSLILTGNATVATPTASGHAVTKSYADALVAGGSPDATTTSKGIVKLAGDLAGTALLPTVPGLATKAADSSVVHNTGAETIAGVKTFTSSPSVPTPSGSTDAVTKAYADLRALDTAVVHNTGTETVGGAKTFSSGVVLTGGVTGNVVATGSIRGSNTGQFDPTDFNLKAWNFPGYLCPGATVLGTIVAAGKLFVMKVWNPISQTISNLNMFIITAGAGLTAGQNFGGLYSNAGALLSQSVDQAANWAATGLNTMALATPQSCAAGYYYVAVFYNGTTAPQFSRANTASGGVNNLGLTGSSALWATTSDTGKTTTMPSTLGTRTESTTSFWCGVS